MNKQQSLNDIKSIKNMMEESTRFLSLSGLSGIFPGVFALLGAAVAYFVVLDAGTIKYDEYMQSLSDIRTYDIRLRLAGIAMAVLALSLLTAGFFSWRKAIVAGKSLWSPALKRLLFHLLLPVAVGGIFSGLLIYHNNISLVAATMLIFYGIGLVNASKFTFSEIHYLGLVEIGLGILSGIFIHHGLLFWTLGFGVMHVLYGTLMYIRHK